MMAFILGAIGSLLVISLWTKKYLPGKPQESTMKFFGYTILCSMAITIPLLKYIN